MSTRSGGEGRAARRIQRPRRRAHRLLAPLLALLAIQFTAAASAAEPALTTASRPAVARVEMPGRWSKEYRRHWGLHAIKADPAYAAGATGRRVEVAIIDTGMDGAPPDVLRNVSPRSIDLIPQREIRDGMHSHGAQIAAPLASALDGTGLVGVAPSATVLSVRADLDQPCTLHGCRLTGPMVARGIDYAVAHGARIIILSLAGHDRPRSLEPALERATATGVIVVVAAGNEGQAEPAWPARYAADPRFAGSVVAVGAMKADGTLTGFSNRAGVARTGYIVAPGAQVPVDCGGVDCELVSGTSFATAYVAGALALLLDAHPDLTGREAVRLLLDSARDLGVKGPDPVYGRGRLDVARAFELARAAKAPVVAARTSMAD